MKNLIVIVSILGLLLMSCSKEHSQKPPINTEGATKHAVKINVSAFTISTGTIGLKKNLALKTDDASDTSLTAAGILCYYYVVYDVNGKEIRRICRTAADPTHEINYYGANGATTLQQADLTSTPTNDAYGAVTDSLATGTYTVIILGVHGAYKSFFIDSHQEAYGGNIAYNPLSTAFFNYAYNLDTNAAEEDTFLYKGTLTVGQTDVQANFSMSRISAELTIKATDAVPPAANRISINFDNEYDGLNLTDLTPNLPSQIEAGYGPAIPIPSANYGQTNTEYNWAIINTTTPMNITVKCVDANGNTIGTPHTINQVKFTPNQRTILTGALFGTITVNGTSGTINANPQFSADSTIIKF